MTNYYILSKIGKNHAVVEGGGITLCGHTIARGERGRNIKWWQQIGCPTCRKAWINAQPTIAETTPSKESTEIKYISDWRRT